MGANVAPDGFAIQTYMVEFEVPGALDGITPGPNIDFSEFNDDPQQIYRPEVEGNLGLIDPDYLVTDEDDEGARGNRWISVFWLDAANAGNVGAVLEVVDAVDGSPVTQENVTNLVGLSRYYRRSGILVPQGSLLRISGFDAGPTPHRIRIHISYLTDDGLLFAQNVLCCFEQAGGAVETWEQVLQNGPASGGEDALMTGGSTFRLTPGSNIDFQDTFLVNNDAQPTIDDAYAFGALDARWSASYSRVKLAVADEDGGGTTEFLFGGYSVGFIGGPAYAVAGSTARLQIANPVAPIDSASMVSGKAEAEVAGGLAEVLASGIASHVLGSARAESADNARMRATGPYSFAGGGARAYGYDSTIEATGESSFAFGYARSYAGYGTAILRASGQGSMARGDCRYNANMIASGNGSFVSGQAYGLAGQVANILASERGSHALGSTIGAGYLLASGGGSFATGIAVNNGRLIASGGGSFVLGYPTNPSGYAGVPTIQATTEGGPLAGGSVTAGDYDATIEAVAAGAFAWGRCAQDPGKSADTIMSASGRGSFALGIAYDENASLVAGGDASFVCGLAISYGSSVATMESTVAADGAWVGGFVGATGGYIGRIAVEENGAIALGKCAAITGNRYITATEEGAFALGRAQDGSIYSSGYGSLAHGAAESGYDITASGDGSFACGSTSTGDIEATVENAVQFGPGTNADVDSVKIGTAGIHFKGTTGTFAGYANGQFWMNGGNIYCYTGGVVKSLTSI